MVIRMPKIHTKGDVAGNRVAGIRSDIKLSHGGAGTWLKLKADAVDRANNFGRTHQGIAPNFHGRRPCMGLLSGQGDVKPTLALGPLDDANSLFFVLQDRALFYVYLKKSGNVADLSVI